MYYDGIISKPSLDELYHHGIKGQKWGVQNGPPYPLSPEKQRKVADNIKSDVEKYHKAVKEGKTNPSEVDEGDIVLKSISGDIMDRQDDLIAIAYNLYKFEPGSKGFDEALKYADQWVQKLTDDLIKEVKDEPITIFEGSSKDGSVILKRESTLGDLMSESIEDFSARVVESYIEQLKEYEKETGKKV